MVRSRGSSGQAVPGCHGQKGCTRRGRPRSVPRVARVCKRSATVARLPSPAAPRPFAFRLAPGVAPRCVAVPKGAMSRRTLPPTLACSLPPTCGPLAAYPLVPALSNAKVSASGCGFMPGSRPSPGLVVRPLRSKVPWRPCKRGSPRTRDCRPRVVRPELFVLTQFSKNRFLSVPDVGRRSGRFQESSEREFPFPDCPWLVIDVRGRCAFASSPRLLPAAKGGARRGA